MGLLEPDGRHGGRDGEADLKGSMRSMPRRGRLHAVNISRNAPAAPVDEIVRTASAGPRPLRCRWPCASTWSRRPAPPAGPSSDRARFHDRPCLSEKLPPRIAQKQSDAPRHRPRRDQAASRPISASEGNSSTDTTTPSARWPALAATSTVQADSEIRKAHVERLAFREILRRPLGIVGHGREIVVRIARMLGHYRPMSLLLARPRLIGCGEVQSMIGDVRQALGFVQTIFMPCAPRAVLCGA